MKKKTTLLLLGIIGLTLLLTSCLEGGSRNYDENSVVYLAMDNTSGRIYGRTISGRLITSAGMQLMTPGSFQFLRYSWTEEYGYTTIENSLQADNVTIVGDPIQISRVPLRMNQQPPQVETPLKFVGVDSPVYAEDKVYLADHWLFQYACEIKKGQTASVNFYNVEDEEASENDITIVIDLTISGVPDAGASTTTKTDIIALDMSQLRATYEGTSATTTKDLKITFQYYMKGQDQRIDSQVYRMKVKGN